MVKTPTLVIMRPEIRGTGELMAQALIRIKERCMKDEFAETNGDELADHLLDSFGLPLDKARYLLLVALDGEKIVGHAIGRIDVGYENRRHCTLGFYALDKGYRWRRVIQDALHEFEAWAKELGCSELRLSTLTTAHARLYGLSRYGKFEPRFVTMARRI
jgi:GNAT superfamily N-acetyltransferase